MSTKRVPRESEYPNPLAIIDESFNREAMFKVALQTESVHSESFSRLDCMKSGVTF
jgi:hypothetical protein